MPDDPATYRYTYIRRSPPSLLCVAQQHRSGRRGVRCVEDGRKSEPEQPPASVHRPYLAPSSCPVLGRSGKCGARNRTCWAQSSSTNTRSHRCFRCRCHCGDRVCRVVCSGAGSSHPEGVWRLCNGLPDRRGRRHRGALGPGSAVDVVADPPSNAAPGGMASHRGDDWVQRGGGVAGSCGSRDAWGDPLALRCDGRGGPSRRRPTGGYHGRPAHGGCTTLALDSCPASYVPAVASDDALGDQEVRRCNPCGAAAAHLSGTSARPIRSRMAVEGSRGGPAAVEDCPIRRLARWCGPSRCARTRAGRRERPQAGAVGGSR